MRCVALCLCFVSTLALAEEWIVAHENLTLRANWQQAGDMDSPTFVLLHGTLAHNRMEIIDGLQTVLADRGFSSLAVNLSLGIDARESSNYPCEHPHSHRHEDAVAELGVWVHELVNKGYGSLVLAGHSRGGNQVARYLRQYPRDEIIAGVLIAPAVDADQPDETEQALLQQAQQEEWLEGVDLLYCQNTRVSGASYSSYYTPDEAFDSLLVAEHIAIPLLLIAGSDDQVVDTLPGRFAEMRSVGKLGQVSYHLLDGADHFFRDLYLEDIGDITEEFIGNL